MDYPEIVNQDYQGSELRLTLAIDSKLDAFDGHFDQFPIVPGVVQVAWAKYYFSSLLSPKLQLATTCQVQKMSALKFQQVMTSSHQVQLTINFDQAKECFTFSFHNSEHKFSSGKVFVTSFELNN